MATRLYPFDHLTLPFAITAKRWVQVESSSKLYPLLNDYVPKNLVTGSDFEAKLSFRSYQADVNARNSSYSDSDEDQDEFDSSCESCGLEGECDGNKTDYARISLTSGFGVFHFRDNKGRVLIGLHQRIGEPVGTNCGASQLTNWVLFTDGEVAEVAMFLEALVEESEKTHGGVFNIFNWNVRHQYWQREASCRVRPMDSVILPEETKERLLQDMSRFLSKESRAFYNRHGIPYRRSYLFYGLPGTGKTSLVQALAGHFKRSVSFLQPTHPSMTDDSLRQAIVRVPAKTIVVFEDIDSLFAKDRSNKVSQSSLTFSGLLNALDGVGNPNGQIFVLTTNLRDQLDPALIRNGRVDLHVEFTHATDSQIRKMWSSFYPGAEDRADDFVVALRGALGERQVVACALQHYFVLQMRNSAEEALANVGLIVEDMKEKEGADKDCELSAGGAASCNGADKPAASQCDSVAAVKALRKKPTGPAASHVHVHIHRGFLAASDDCGDIGDCEGDADAD